MCNSNSKPLQIGDKVSIEIVITDLDEYGYYHAHCATRPWFVGESGRIEAEASQVST